MATTKSPSFSPPILSLPSILKPNHISSSSSSILCNSQFPKFSSKKQFCSKTPILFSSAIPLKSAQKWRNSALPQNILLLEADPVENSQLIESTSSDDGVFSIISALLFVAFVGLSILTIGVIYIAVTDFLQKREKDNFEKEEAAKKKSGKKVRARSRSGPKGFGQKVEEDDDAEL